MKRALSYILTISFCISLCACSYSPTPTPTTTVKEEVPFSEALEYDYPAYIDIRSIEPAYSLTNSFNQVSHIVCRCITTSGRMVWVYISVGKYNKYFDEHTVIYSFGALSVEKIYISARIHGKTISADSITPDLAAASKSILLKFESVETPIE